MLLSIIILNYKKKDLTLSCIKSLYEQFSHQFKINIFEAIVVDNASNDDSVSALQEEIKKKNYKNMKVIASPENTGYGKGCNLGAQYTKGTYLLFLNNDTLIKDKGIVEMVHFMNMHRDIAILGGQLSNFDGSKQPSTGKFYTLYNTFLLLLGMQKYGVLDKNPSTISQVDWVKGGLFMIRTEVFKALSGFDEKIFMYTEDMELCYRANLEGYKTYFYPFVTVVHAEHGSSSRTFAIIYIYKGLLYYYKKHKNYLEYSIIKTLLYMKAVTAIIIGNITRNSYLVKTYKQAIRF